MKLLHSLFCFCLLSPSLLRAQAGVEARTALVIGCDYADTPHRLPSPAKDARDMAAKLTQLGFVVTLRINPELNEFEKVTNEFSSSLKVRKGVGLFYFSGHGAQVDERNYLIPHKAELNFREDLRTRAYAAQDVVTRMEAAGSRLNLLFLDACRTNELSSSTSKDLTKGFAGMEAASGMLISFASARNAVAIDTGAGSVYTNALLAHIATPSISVLDMLTRVSAQVKKETFGKQIPFMEVGLDGTFAFAPNASTVPPVSLVAGNRAPSLSGLSSPAFRTQLSGLPLPSNSRPLASWSADSLLTTNAFSDLYQIGSEHSAPAAGIRPFSSTLPPASTGTVQTPPWRAPYNLSPGNPPVR
jgi:hypothetical protein